MELQKKSAEILNNVLSAERDRLVLWTPVLLACGIGLYFILLFEPPWWAAVAAFVATAGLAWAGRGRYGLKIALIALALVAAGFMTASLRTQMVAAPALYSTLYYRTVQGTIDDIQAKEEGGKLILSDILIERISSRSMPLRASISLKEYPKDLKVGDRVEVKAILFPPPTPSMPDAYDFARQYYFDQIGAVGFAPKQPMLLEQGAPKHFDMLLTALRLSLNGRIVSAMSPEGGPVAAALMVGEMSAVSTEVRDAMRDSGIYHVLSISGLHMSLAAGLLFFSVRLLLSLYPAWALRLPVKKIAAVLGLLGSFIYLLLAGYPVPAVRSFVMVACVMLAICFDRRGISLYSLAWAAILILFFQPEALLGASFQLSFAATLAMLALYERYSHHLHPQGRGLTHLVWIYMLGLMATSLVASIATAPLVIYHFNRFTIWGIAANMLLMPLVSFWIMPLAILAFLLMPFGAEAFALEWLDMGIGWMLSGARWFASLPYAAIPVPPLTFGGLLLAVAGGVWLCLMSGRWRLAGIAGVALGMGSIVLHQPYDLLVSDDGKQVALRTEDGSFLFLKGKPDNYDGQVWLRYHGQQDAIKLADLSPAAGHECEQGWCYFNSHGRTIALAMEKEASDHFCYIKADIVISDDYLDKQPCVPFAPLVADRKFLLRNGAMGIRFDAQGVDVTTSGARSEKRPWSAQAHYELYHYRSPAISEE